ncbi:MAG: hypothetical protein NT069_32705, partial [Planctomycetota bacterium]|nr:hypothetical protein [Planctomycetota bacterium]
MACCVLIAATAALSSDGVADRPTGKATTKSAPNDGVAAELSEPELRSSIAKVLAQLRSPRRAERADAERRLRELGPRVLPWLPADEELDSASVRDVIGRIRIAHEEQLARDTTRASRLTLQGTKSLADWAVEITRQTGNRFILDELTEESRNREWKFDHQPDDFWPAFDRFVAELQLDWRIDAEQSAIYLLERGKSTADRTPELTLSYQGIHRVVVEQARLRPRENGSPLLRVRLSITSEPRVRHLLFQLSNANQVATPLTG